MSKRERDLQNKLDPLRAEVSRLTLELEQAASKEQAISRELEGEREGLVDFFLERTSYSPGVVLFAVLCTGYGYSSS